MSQSKTQAVIRNMLQWPQHVVLAFPLLTRELIEQSARKRTYILRTVYAATVYGFVLWKFWSVLGSWSTQSFSLLGSGRDLFEALAWLQFCGLYLFLPAMTSGVLTIEKERDTLSLLLLTRLRPWSILIGKLFSRLVPMASFMMLSLPLVAVAYSLGGVESNEILSLAWALFVTSLQVGALAVACSAWYRTTAAAFLATYLIGAALIVGPPFIYRGFGYYDPFGILDFAFQFGSIYGLFSDQAGNYIEVTLVLFGPWLCLFPGSQGSSLELTVARSVPIMLFTGACLVFAWGVLWRRAFLQPSNLLLNVFRSLDKTFHRLNQNRFTKGIVLTHEDVTLPVYDPIRWRETKKRSLGTTRYLVRILLVLEVPVLFGMLVPSGGNSNELAPVHISAWVLWVFATLVIAIQSTGLIGSERSRQTLDVLLTVPMSSDTIVREQFAGVWRMIRMLWIPFATVYVFQAWWATWVGFYSPAGETIFGIVRGLLATMIYPPLIAMLGFHFGMRCRSQAQAVLVTLTVITAVCAIPLVVVGLLEPGGPSPVSLLTGFKWISPATAITAMSQPYYYQYWYGNSGEWTRTAWMGLILHFMFYGAYLIWLWSRTMKTFALYVHRNDGQIVDDDDIDRLSRLRQKIVGGGVFRAAADDE